MSFILDALKKSESERQRQTTPGIADLPEAASRSSSRNWLWILAVLLAVNLLVLLSLAYRPGQSPGDVPASPPAAPPAQSPEPVVADGTTDRTMESSNVAAELPEQPAAQQPAPERSNPAEAQPEPERQVVSQTTGRPTVTDGLRTLNELRATHELQIPEMRIDIHVFSAVAGERFVFINMRKYRERDTLADGPVVREITPDGVILEYDGLDFLLPRE